MLETACEDITVVDDNDCVTNEGLDDTSFDETSQTEQAKDNNTITVTYLDIARKNSPEVNVAVDIEESNNELSNDYIDNDEELSNVLLMTAKEEDSWVHVKR